MELDECLCSHESRTKSGSVVEEYIFLNMNMGEGIVQLNILEAAWRTVCYIMQQIYIGSLKKYVGEMVWLGEKGVYIVEAVLKFLLGVNRGRE